MPIGNSTSDYSSVAQWYDATRNMPAELLSKCFTRFFDTVDFPAGQRILDAGCGTAQLSLPLIAAGYRVVGVDVSEAMLARARAKVRPGWHAEFRVEDVRAMSFGDGHFGATVVSKLFQHVPSWESAVDEIRRVTRPDGFLLHINEKGAFQNAVRKRFAWQCDQRGLTDRYRGLRDRAKLAEYVEANGGVRVHLDVSDLAWSKQITYDEALRHLEQRLHSEFWTLTDDQYDEVLGSVRQWVSTLPEGTATVEHMTPFLTAEIFRWC